MKSQLDLLFYFFLVLGYIFVSIAAKSLGKRIGKVTNQQMKKAGTLNSYLMVILKNHKLAKIFQRENYEQERANKLIEDLKETSQKIIKIVYFIDLCLRHGKFFLILDK